MSYQTVEVELENGHVRPAAGEPLPAKARALLTILEAKRTAGKQATKKAKESKRSLADRKPLARSLGDALRELGLVGSGKHTDLSTNPKHMDDFGR